MGTELAKSPPARRSRTSLTISSRVRPIQSRWIMMVPSVKIKILTPTSIRAQEGPTRTASAEDLDEPDPRESVAQDLLGIRPQPAIEDGRCSLPTHRFP